MTSEILDFIQSEKYILAFQIMFNVFSLELVMLNKNEIVIC